MKVTIKDIVKETGLSASTVSRVLTGNGYVKDETREQVERAVQHLGYRPPQTARKRPGTEKTMLVIVGDITNQFYAEIIRGIEQVLELQGFKVLLCSSNDDSDKEERYLAYANEQGFWGAAMITARETPALVRLLRQMEMPVVMVNRYLRSYDCDAVCIDNYRGGYMAVQYLLEMGHTRISHLAGPMHSTASADRCRGYMDALRDNGLEPNASAVYQGNLRYDKGCEYAEYFVKNNLDYTAVFCGNDIMARAFIEQLGVLGRQVPKDVSVLSFDETQSVSVGGMHITNISKNPLEMGQAAAQTLIHRMESPHAEVRKVIFPPQLHVWDSVRKLSHT